MDSVKSTNELMNELKEASSFGQYAETNEEGFLQENASGENPGESFAQALSETEDTCPFCGARLPKGASYCVFCMRLLKERREIPVKKRRTGRQGRVFLAVFGVFAILMAVGAVFFFLKRPAPEKELFEHFPEAREFRLLAAGASEEDSRQIWSQEAFVLMRQEGGFSVYETQSSLSEEPVRVAFSDDGKSLFAALSGVSPHDAEEAEKLTETLFSAVYQYYPDNLQEILRNEENFTSENGPDETLRTLLSAAGISLWEDARIQKSLPIAADRYENAPAARVWEAVSGDQRSIFILFGEEMP